MDIGVLRAQQPPIASNVPGAPLNVAGYEQLLGLRVWV